jgi:hypothetical protein
MQPAGSGPALRAPGAEEPGGWRWLLDEIEVLRLRFRLGPRAPFSPPPFPGSMIRGAFGHALKSAVCVRDHRACERCDLVAICAYPRIFEPSRDGPGEAGRGPLRRTPPFFFEWDARIGGRAPSTEPWEVDLFLVGKACELASPAVTAMARAAAGGLGTSRTAHEVLGVEARGPDPVRALAPPLGPTLRLLTPLRLREGGALAARFSFEGFVRAALRRFRLLGGGGGGVDEGAIDRAREVRVARENVGWFDWTRRSARQETTMELGGLLGEVELEGDLAPLAPVLAAAAVLHVGKNATFGLGRVGVG